MKKILIGFMVMTVMASSLCHAAGPDTTVDALIEKLVDKGILTADEADLLKGRIVYDSKVIQEANMKRDIPEWVQNSKFSGDMRVRFQDQKRKNGSVNNSQGRIRARLNFETKLTDKAKVVFGIATNGGANNARSNNLTFSGDTSTEAANKPFAKTNVVLNKAYGAYTFNPNVSFMAGKMDNPIWEPMEFLWDGDITPEGGSLRLDKKINDNFGVWATGNSFVLNNFSASTSDPFMWVVQTGLNAKAGEKLDAKLVGTYQGYANIKSGFTGSRTNNTAGSAGIGANSLLYDYTAPMGAVDVGINDPFGELLPSRIYIPRVGVFGQYTQNPSPDTDNKAFMAGVYMGNSKVSGFGTWKATAAFKKIEKDAWLDILPDSDFYSGNTGVKGFESIFEFGLAKNMTFVFDYYQARRIKVANKAPEHLFQADINWKF